MANTFLTPEIVAKEALMVLQSNLVMADLVHRDYSDEFVNVGDTISVRKPAKFVAKNFAGTTSVQDISEGSVPVKLDRFRDVTVAVTAKQLTLDIADFSEQVITPAMQAIAQAVDQDLLALGIGAASYKVRSSEDTSDLKDIAEIAKQMDINKVPQQNRHLVLHPTHKYRYALSENLSKVSYAGDNMTLRDALLGRVYSLETYMDQNAPDSAAKKPGTATGFTVTGTAGNSYATFADIEGTISAGDAFILDGYLYRCLQGGTGKLNLDQPLMTTCSAKSVTPVNKPHSLAFHRNGIALVTRRLALPMGAANAAYASADGLAVRVVYDYDSTTKTDKVSFDIIYGIKDLDQDMICALVG